MFSSFIDLKEPGVGSPETLALRLSGTNLEWPGKATTCLQLLGCIICKVVEINYLKYPFKLRYSRIT